MRGTPLSSNSVEPLANNAKAAVKGRIAVPALPMYSLALAKLVEWPKPVISTVEPTLEPFLTMWQPSCDNAVSMTRVSSESSKSCTNVVPWLRAASNRTRFEMLLEPGKTTVPLARQSGGISKKWVLYMLMG